MDGPAFARGRALTMSGPALAAALALAACKKDEAPVYTLYQSNPLDLAARLRFATFDIPNKGIAKNGGKPINRTNCEMTAVALNTMIRRANNGAQPVHYWCEQGKYREEGVLKLPSPLRSAPAAHAPSSA